MSRGVPFFHDIDEEKEGDDGKKGEGDIDDDGLGELDVETVERQKQGCQQSSETVAQAPAQQIERDNRAQVEENGDRSAEEDEEGKIIGEQAAKSVQRFDPSDEEPQAQGNRLEGEVDVERQGGIVEEVGVEIEGTGGGAPEGAGLEDWRGFFEEVGQPALEAVRSGETCEEQEEGDGQAVAAAESVQARE